jgi:deoxyribonuclease-4
MPRFGAHLSIAGGVSQAACRARDLGCDCLQIFVKPPQQWRLQDLDEEEIARFREAVGDAGLEPVVAHASYLLNVASPDAALWERSVACLLTEWDRAEALGLAGLVLHPGSHVESGEAAGLERVAQALARLGRERPQRTVPILLETTAGAGSTLGGTFEQLAHLFEACNTGRAGQEGSGTSPNGAKGAKHQPPLGLAIDTCHLWAAGYDVASAEGLDATLAELDEAVGLSRLAVVHANDAKGERGSRLDRHAAIGRGTIGRAGFRRILNHPALSKAAFILETPKEDARGRPMDPVNLRTLRGLVQA